MEKERRVKNKVIYRQACWQDIDALCELELKVWGKEMAAGRDKWESRLKIFPEGVNVAEKDRKLVGVLVIQMIKWNYPPGYFPTWEEVTANGYITNHDSDGDTMYGVNLTVLPGMPGVAQRLTQLGISYKKKSGAKNGYFGCRIPSLKSFLKKRKISEVDNDIVKAAALHDPEVRFFIQNGLRLKYIKEKYFLPDNQSLGWGIILESE
jgi:hypothetical protein